MVCVVDVFHMQHSATVKMPDNKRHAKVPVRKQSLNKRKSKMVTKNSSGKFKKDIVDRTKPKIVQETKHAGRKRPFQNQQNQGKKKKRKI